MKPRFYCIYFSGKNRYGEYGHPEVRFFVEEWADYSGTGGHYMDGQEVCCIVYQTDRNKGFSLLRAYAPEIRISGGYSRIRTNIGKKLIRAVIGMEHGFHPREILRLCKKLKVEKRQYIPIKYSPESAGTSKEAIPTRMKKFAQAWWDAKISGRELHLV